MTREARSVLKEERIPEAADPTELGEKKKRPREVAFMDVNLCFAPSVMLPCSQVHSANIDAGCWRG